MKQTIAQAISQSFLDWRDAETVHLIEFNFPIKTKGQGQNKRPETQTFEMMVAEVAQEQVSKKAEDAHLGARISMVVSKRNQDMDNCEKAIFDGLKQIAFGDDKVFDYVEKVRVKSPTIEDQGFVVEIVRLVPKREAWV